MKSRFIKLAGFFVFVALLSGLNSRLPAAPLGTGFSYQGRLNDSGLPANGIYDLRFAIYDAADGSGVIVAGPLTNSAIAVTNGLLMASLDFGLSPFDGNMKWLEIAVRTNGGSAFRSLNPRQALSPAPYALFAQNAGAAASAAVAATASNVVNNAVSSAGIAPGQVVKSLNGLRDAVALAAGANVSFATNANTLTISAAGGGVTGGWSTTGNAGTTPAANFIGTSDGQPLILKAANVGINTNNPKAALHVNGAVLATRFIGDGSGLTNVPATPFTFTGLAVTNNGAAARGIEVAGRYAYVANGIDGLRIYDISDPAHPINVGRDADFGWDATAVAISGQTAFVASETLYTVDISVPTNPVTLGKSSGNRYNYGVAVTGNLACLAADADGLFTYDVSNRTNPVSLGHIDNGGRASGVAISGNFAFLANDSDGLRIYNLSNPANPVNIAHINNGGLARGVTVSGGIAFLANDADGLRIYNVSNPTNPISIGHIYEAGHAYGVALSGRFAFVANYEDGLRVYDVSDPAHPLAVSAMPLAGDGFSLAVATSEYYAFAANEIGGLATYFAAPLATLPGVVSARNFIGDGFGLTNLDAGQLTGQMAPPLLAGLWQSTGNAGTSPDLNFLGTLDDQPMEMRASGHRSLRLERNGSVTVDPADSNRGGLDPGLTFGKNSGAGIASQRADSSLPDQFGLTFFTDHQPRLVFDLVGNIFVGGLTGDKAKLNLGNTWLNQNDLFLNNASDVSNRLDGLGWYGPVKPFGPNYPDGPVLYGFRGGVLGTTLSGPDASLTWDQDHVTVTKELDAAKTVNVAGDINTAGYVNAVGLSARNTPGVNWDQTLATLDQSGIDPEDVLATCSNQRPAPGFFVITASAAVSINATSFTLKLMDSTDPANPVELTSATIMDSEPGVLFQVFQTVATLNWVVPIAAAGPKQSFALIGRTVAGSTEIRARNLTVMYFPRQNN